MAEFLTTNGTSHHLENLIIDARKKLILVSPYLQLSKTLFERLKDASNRGVQITIVYGKDELKPNEKNSLAQLKTVTLYYFQNLHAKCYFNEEKMIITSMNMYEFSEKNNREMGVLIDRVADKQLFEKAITETSSIVDSADKQELNRSNTKNKDDRQEERPASNTARGYCIRCETRIPFDPGKPLCVECYSIWSKYSDWDYPENVCHKCGEYEETSMSRPQCYDCYLRSQYDADMDTIKNSVIGLHKSLTKSYPNDKVNKGDSYVYFNKLVIGIDGIINSKNFTLKFKNQNISEASLNENAKVLQSRFKSYTIVNEKHENNCKYLTLALKEGNTGEIASIIDTVRTLKFRL